MFFPASAAGPSPMGTIALAHKAGAQAIARARWYTFVHVHPAAD